jgi:hypothetical protein
VAIIINLQQILDLCLVAKIIKIISRTRAYLVRQVLLLLLASSTSLQMLLNNQVVLFLELRTISNNLDKVYFQAWVKITRINSQVVNRKQVYLVSNQHRVVYSVDQLHSKLKHQDRHLYFLVLVNRILNSKLASILVVAKLICQLVDWCRIMQRHIHYRILQILGHNTM